MTDDISKGIAASRDQFLAGHLSPELERHCRNVGRVAVEFACLEEDIGKLVVTLETGGGGSGLDYMEVVRHSNGIPRRLRRLAKQTPGATALDLHAVANDYLRLKTERDRFAHSSVGTTVTRDGESKVYHLRTMQQKHPRGHDHPNGPVSALPTDDETNQLCCEMRNIRQGLRDSYLSLSMKGLTRNLVKPVLSPGVHLPTAIRLPIKGVSVGTFLSPTFERLSQMLYEGASRRVPSGLDRLSQVLHEGASGRLRVKDDG